MTTIRARAERTIRRAQGLTATHLAAILFDDRRATSRLQFSLSVLLSRGHIRREGDGGHGDPHRYYPAETSS